MSAMRIGADYYPEHWPRSRWEEDAKLMKEAGFNITRLAEFSWVKLEPEEDRYDFGWLDEAVAVLGKQGIACILCTPTPTMPKWLYDQYPEVVYQEQDGNPGHFGNRQNNCFSSKTYRYFSRKITRALAEHFAGNPHVIGWQLDNELHGPYCYCHSCENAFRQYLKNKFGTIEALNEAYGTIFWSQCYGSFHEVHLPRHSHPNLSLGLDHRRFHSDLLISFAKEQADIIREVCPQHFITHNFMGFAPNVDYYKLGEMLDFVSHDYYYNGSAWEDRFDSYMHGAAALDLMRGCKKQNFFIMENSAGPIGWETYSRNLRPGEMRRMTFQNMAHGADGQIWFRWRTSRYGTEQYWHALLGHDGIPGRRYEEARQTANDLQKVWSTLNGSVMKSEAAFVLDYSDRWAFMQQKNNGRFDPIEALLPYYRALYEKGVNADFISGDEIPEGYKLIVLPYKYIVTEEYAEKLRAYIKNGGILLTTCRSGVKNPDNVPHALTLPGYLREIAGIRVEEYETIPSDRAYSIVYGDESFQGRLLADWIIPENAEVLANYNEESIAFPAVTKNAYGDGAVYYVGTVPSDELARKVVRRILQETGVRQLDLPEHTEAAVWNKDGEEYVFVLNHSQETKDIGLRGVDLLTGKDTDGNLILAPDGVAVIQTN